MNKKNIFAFVLTLALVVSCSKTNNDAIQPLAYPSFGAESAINIDGLSFDAMEPFISPDGNYLFFNNLNDGLETKLFFATKINNSNFTYIGPLPGTNQLIAPHLDAVADMDANGSFYWTSTRDYPNQLDTLFCGTINSGNVTNGERVHGDFNKNSSGWLVMDHNITEDGTYLYFNNGRFDTQNCQGPCETNIGIAKKITSTLFNTLQNSTFLLEKVNDESYINYAPAITSDNLELYYTRYLKGQITTNTIFEICVAIRNTKEASFSAPKVLFSETTATLVEAPTLTRDKKIMYYHKKSGNLYKIVMRNRN